MVCIIISDFSSDCLLLSSAKCSADLSPTVVKTRRKGPKNGSNPGKQLRFLFHHLGRLRVTNSSKCGQQTNVQIVGQVQSEIVTRSKTKIVPKVAEPSPPSLPKPQPTAKKLIKKATKKSTISQKFVRKLCKYLEECRQKGLNKEKVCKKEFQPFLPVIKIKKLDMSSIEGLKSAKRETLPVVGVSKKSKTKKCLSKSGQSLLLKKKKRSVVVCPPKAMVKVCGTGKKRSESDLLTKKCTFCGNDGNYKTRHRLMSSYLKSVFPRPETRSYGTHLKVKITKNWSSRVDRKSVV